MWDRAEEALAQALNTKELTYKVFEGEGAFTDQK